MQRKNRFGRVILGCLNLFYSRETSTLYWQLVHFTNAFKGLSYGCIKVLLILVLFIICVARGYSLWDLFSCSIMFVLYPVCLIFVFGGFCRALWSSHWGTGSWFSLFCRMQAVCNDFFDLPISLTVHLHRVLFLYHCVIQHLSGSCASKTGLSISSLYWLFQVGSSVTIILRFFVGGFDLCLFGFVGFLFLLVSGKGCGL